jgi:hypothetical protein
MSKEIKFKALRRNYSGTGYREIDKTGDGLEFDMDTARDGIWLMPKNGHRIFIDCDSKTGVFRIVFDETEFERQKHYE